MNDLLAWITVAGLVLISVLTRSFFFLSVKEWPFPAWLKTGLTYAPVGALCAVAVPAVLMPSPAVGQGTGWEPRAVAACLALAFAWWRKDMLLTIVVGMTAFHAANVWLVR